MSMMFRPQQVIPLQSAIRKYGTLIFSATAAGGTKVYTGTGSNPPSLLMLICK
ncbi:MAG TPA: hypothetical protein VK787_15445 [Puia sp.]|nr:hypothetical protein [Puia sp.]